MYYALVCFSALSCALAAPQYQNQGGALVRGTYGSFQLIQNVTIGGGADDIDIEALMERLKKEGVQGFANPGYGANANKDGEYKVKFDLPPGFKEDDITMDVKEGIVKVVAEHEEGSKLTHIETMRSVPRNLNLTSSSAEFKDGKLTITFEVKKEENTI